MFALQCFELLNIFACIFYLPRNTALKAHFDVVNVLLHLFADYSEIVFGVKKDLLFIAKFGKIL